MLLVVPCVLISLLWWRVEDLPGALFDRFGPGLVDHGLQVTLDYLGEDTTDADWEV